MARVMQVPVTLKVETRRMRLEIDAEKRAIIEEKVAETTFKEFLQLALDAYQPLGRGFAQARQALKIADIIDAANGAISLEDADYKVVKEAVESHNWNPAFARKVVPYFDAVEKAEEVKKA